MSSQWRVSAAGVVGLDYTAIRPVLQLVGIKRADWPGIFEDIRVMESVASRIINGSTQSG